MTMGNKQQKHPELFAQEAIDQRKAHWDNSVEYSNDDLRPSSNIIVNFSCESDRHDFAKAIGQKISSKTRSVWFGGCEFDNPADFFWGGSMDKNRYPIYVISKGRAKKRLTCDTLDAMGCDYRLVVEPQEANEYVSSGACADKILETPFSNLGQGSIPARNFVWDHAASIGASKHWILDDNIDGIFRFHENRKIRVLCPIPFAYIEDFSDMFSNVMISGMQYDYFILRKNGSIPAYDFNRRVYSCMLIDHSCHHRWRGRYNEDTDLCIRIMKSGLCTVLFNAFCCGKAATMTMTGGNTDELYAQDGRKKMAESLSNQHPGIATTHERWGRITHKVDYSSINKTAPIKVGDFKASRDYSMRLQKKDACK